MAKFHKVKVISRNIITDWIQTIRNMLGFDLKAYTNAIDKGITEIQEQIPEKTKWYKIDIEQIDGAFIIVIYGESKWK